MKVLTPEQRLSAGLDAYRQLQWAFDPNASQIAQLRAASVNERRITTLYPLDFEAYLPLLNRLLDDSALAKDAVEKCYAGGKLSADRLALAGIGDEALDEFYERYVSPDSDELDELFSTTINAYTSYWTNFPMPSFGVTEQDQASSEVSYLMENLALSAWLLANWEQSNILSDDFTWMDLDLAQKLLNDVLDQALSFFERIWLPLIEKAAA